MPKSKHIMIGLFWGTALTCPAALPLVIADPGQSAVPVNDASFGSTELSGLTWAGSNRYYAVSDQVPTLYALTIKLDPDTGFILTNDVVGSVSLPAGSDLEGVAYNPFNHSVYISDEIGPAVREHDISTGGLMATIQVPPVFTRARPCCSLESLSLRAGHEALWTANEEALDGDGPLSTTATGTVVRLLKYTAGLNPSGQWAYPVDPITAPLNGQERSGVSDLTALPDGRLLILERELGDKGFFEPPFRTRIYEVDCTSATEVSGITNLQDAAYTPAGKVLLFEMNSFYNFEGMALGPYLTNDQYALLLVADDGGSPFPQVLYSLFISGLGPPDSDLDGLPDYWEARHFGSPFAGNPDEDTDEDGFNNRREYIADTNPTNKVSLFAIHSVSVSGETAIAFLSSSNRVYRIEGCEDLTAQEWVDLQGPIAGTGALISQPVTNQVPREHYRVGVRLP